MRVGLIQFPCSGDRDSNLSRALALASEARARGASLVCFPEFFAYPWFPSAEQPTDTFAETIDGPTVTACRELAQREQCFLLVSIHERAPDDRLYNTSVLIGRDGGVGLYRKKHLPDEPGFREARHYSPGDDGFPVFQTELGCIGIQICSDVMFPEGGRVLARKGAQILLVQRASMASTTEQWGVVMRASAIVNGCYVVTANRTGREGDVEFAGDSQVIDPTGTVISRAESLEDVVIADLDLALVERVREGYPFYIDRRPKLYGELVADKLDHPR